MNERQKKISVGKGERIVFATWRNEGLSASEKNRLRQLLQEQIRPVSFWQRTEQFFRGEGVLFPHRQALLFSLILLFVVSGGIGVASASERSLPGESLYVFKTEWNEPIRGAFLFTSQAKAEWQRTRIERRLREAEALARGGNFGETEAAEISVLIGEHQTLLDRYTDERDSASQKEWEERLRQVEVQVEEEKEEGETDREDHDNSDDEKKKEEDDKEKGGQSTLFDESDAEQDDKNRKDVRTREDQEKNDLKEKEKSRERTKKEKEKQDEKSSSGKDDEKKDEDESKERDRDGSSGGDEEDDDSNQDDEDRDDDDDAEEDESKE